MKFGFIKTAAAVPVVKVADPQANADSIVRLIEHAAVQGAQIVAFPELCITGYTCGDLFGDRTLSEQAMQALNTILEQSRKYPPLCIVGMPLAVDNRLYNTAVVLGGGKIYGIVPKTYLPVYNEFYEGRYFASGAEPHRETLSVLGQTVPFTTDMLFECGETVLGVEICEDLWAPCPPSTHQALCGANLIVNISASNEMVGKHDYRLSLLGGQSARTISGYIYCSAGFGESTTDLAFAASCAIAENGSILAESERFLLEEQITYAEIDIERLMNMRRKKSTFYSAVPLAPMRRIEIALPHDDSLPERPFDPHPFIPNGETEKEKCFREIFNIQVTALASRLKHTRSQSAVIGISGGLDSTLALLVTVEAFNRLGLPRKNIEGITMPGFGTTSRTYNNAVGMIRSLGVSLREIDISKACLQHFSDIGLDSGDRSVTYENSQARERTQILMDVANMTSGLVIGTGDLSELALGWATYNGDHMSMYAVNCGIPKTLVKHIVEWIAAQPGYQPAREFLTDIAATPISPELLPADENGKISQCTESLVGPYELHDFFLYNFIRFGFRPAKLCFMAERAFEGRYDRPTIKKWLVTFLRRFFSQQFKRSAMPDGPKVGSVALSPRGDWRMPSDACAEAWINEAQNI